MIYCKQENILHLTLTSLCILQYGLFILQHIVQGTTEVTKCSDWRKSFSFGRWSSQKVALIGISLNGRINKFKRGNANLLPSLHRYSLPSKATVKLSFHSQQQWTGIYLQTLCTEVILLQLKSPRITTVVCETIHLLSRAEKSYVSNTSYDVPPGLRKF